MNKLYSFQHLKCEDYMYFGLLVEWIHVFTLNCNKHFHYFLLFYKPDY